MHLAVDHDLKYRTRREPRYAGPRVCLRVRNKEAGGVGRAGGKYVDPVAAAVKRVTVHHLSPMRGVQERVRSRGRVHLYPAGTTSVSLTTLSALLLNSSRGDSKPLRFNPYAGVPALGRHEWLFRPQIPGP